MKSKKPEEDEERANASTASVTGTRADRIAPPEATVRSPAQSRLALKKKVRFFYDLQRLRLQTSGRIYKRPANVTIDLAEIDKVILEGRAKALHQAEKDALGDVVDHLKTERFYKTVLSDKSRYKGLGPTMAGVILSEFDITRHDTVSKMWAFAGLRPLSAFRCKTCHSVVEGTPDEPPIKHPKATTKCKYNGHQMLNQEVYASGKAQRPVSGEKLTYNAWLRTKLVGVLADCLIKCGSPWRKLYDDYKHRKQSAGWGKSDGHRHQAAKRYMVKMLLLDIWREWRTFEGLPVREAYSVEYLGMERHAMAITSPGIITRAAESEPPVAETRATYPTTPGTHERATAPTTPDAHGRAVVAAPSEEPERTEDHDTALYEAEVDAELEQLTE